MKYLPVILLFFVLFACTPAHRESAPKDEIPGAVPVIVPAFNADSAFLFVKQQVSFGPRIPNTAAHDSCAAFFVSQLKKYTPHVVVQQANVKAFDGNMLRMQNVIASFQPEKKNRILLASHWDTRPFADQDTLYKNAKFDGANDGASGAGILLEVARQLSSENPVYGVDILLLDAEDYGQPENSNYPPMEDSWCLGSQYWSKNLHVPGYSPAYGILLDMTGAPNATFLMEGVSMQYAPQVVQKVWNTASRLGYSDYFLYREGPPITDDHAYINRIAGIPCIDIIHLDLTSRTGFGRYWHTTSDNMEAVDRNTLKAVGQTLLATIYSEQ